MYTKKLKKANNNYPSTLRHSLGYLPTVLLKAIIEDKILDKKENESEIKFPKTFSFHTTSLFIDISHFFDKNKIKYEATVENNDINNDINNDNLDNSNDEIKKGKQNDLDDIMSPEFFYFCINRYYEKLISIITNHGGDVIFQGNGIYAIWPPDKKEIDSNISSTSERILDESINPEKKSIIMLKDYSMRFRNKKKFNSRNKERMFIYFFNRL
jgi:hypothetical protein